MMSVTHQRAPCEKKTVRHSLRVEQESSPSAPTVVLLDMPDSCSYSSRSWSNRRCQFCPCQLLYSGNFEGFVQKNPTQWSSGWIGVIQASLGVGESELIPQWPWLASHMRVDRSQSRESSICQNHIIPTQFARKNVQFLINSYLEQPTDFKKKNYWS